MTVVESIGDEKPIYNIDISRSFDAGCRHHQRVSRLALRNTGIKPARNPVGFFVPDMRPRLADRLPFLVGFLKDKARGMIFLIAMIQRIDSSPNSDLAAVVALYNQTEQLV